MQGLFARGRSSTSSACAAPTPPSSSSRTARCREENVLGERRQGRQRADERPRLRARGAGGGAARHHAGRARRGHALRRTSASSSASRSGRFQLIQAKLADMYVTMNASQRLCLCRRQGLRPRRDDARGRRRRHSLCRRARDLDARSTRSRCLGGNGYTNDYPARPAVARRKALRDRRRHERDPPHADRAGAVREGGVRGRLRGAAFDDAMTVRKYLAMHILCKV